MVFATPIGAKTMTTTTGKMPTIPRYATFSKLHAERLALQPSPTEIALRSILLEVTPGTRPYSSDSWLPGHLP
jgi:hypothetical protein